RIFHNTNRASHIGLSRLNGGTDLPTAATLFELLFLVGKLQIEAPSRLYPDGWWSFRLQGRSGHAGHSGVQA
ncbi:hypothetical protein ACCS56_37450, partial [Rhizobium ruizarguesonis]